MAIKYRALKPGPETPGSMEFRYGVWDDAGAYVARDTAFNTISAVAYTSVYQGLHILVLKGLALEQMGRSAWHVAAQYKSAETQPMEADETELDFDFQGTQQHIEKSLSTVDRFVPSGQTPINTHNLIGDDGRAVQGTDIYVPGGSFRIRRGFSAVVSSQLKKQIAWAGSVNNVSLTVTDSENRFSLSFDVGEVLYMGMSGGVRSGKIELIAHFLVSLNVSAETVGEITGISKAGWDYLWMKYVEETGVELLTLTPRQVTVERVYRYRDLSEIGFGLLI